MLMTISTWHLCNLCNFNDFPFYNLLCDASAHLIANIYVFMCFRWLKHNKQRNNNNHTVQLHIASTSAMRKYDNFFMFVLCILVVAALSHPFSLSHSLCAVRVHLFILLMDFCPFCAFVRFMAAMFTLNESLLVSTWHRRNVRILWISYCCRLWPSTLRTEHFSVLLFKWFWLCNEFGSFLASWGKRNGQNKWKQRLIPNFNLCWFSRFRFQMVQ